MSCVVRFGFSNVSTSPSVAIYMVMTFGEVLTTLMEVVELKPQFDEGRGGMLTNKKGRCG
jgi:hypothetical protein